MLQFGNFSLSLFVSSQPVVNNCGFVLLQSLLCEALDRDSSKGVTADLISSSPAIEGVGHKRCKLFRNTTMGLTLGLGFLLQTAKSHQERSTIIGIEARAYRVVSGYSEHTP